MHRICFQQSTVYSFLKVWNPLVRKILTANQNISKFSIYSIILFFDCLKQVLVYSMLTKTRLIGSNISFCIKKFLFNKSVHRM